MCLPGRAQLVEMTSDEWLPLKAGLGSNFCCSRDFSHLLDQAHSEEVLIVNRNNQQALSGLCKRKLSEDIGLKARNIQIWWLTLEVTHVRLLISTQVNQWLLLQSQSVRGTQVECRKRDKHQTEEAGIFGTVNKINYWIQK